MMFSPENSQSGTFLHRADPRLKLPVCGLLVILAFAAGSWSRLAVMAIALLVLCTLARCGPVWMARTLWPLRWLLLFTLLLHLFLSPGHTLFGVAWLSRDGMLHGMLVCVQLCLAALAAALLNRTTSAEQTARACGWLLAPLRRLGCPVNHWEELTALVLRFFPIMRDELRATAVSDRDSWSRRIMAWEERLLPVFDRLVERADLMARRVAIGEELPIAGEPLPPFSVRAVADQFLLVGGGMTVLFYLSVGG